MARWLLPCCLLAMILAGCGTPPIVATAPTATPIVIVVTATPRPATPTATATVAPPTPAQAATATPLPRLVGVVSTATSLLDYPDAQRGQAVAELAAAQEVTVLNLTADSSWAQIGTRAGALGWVDSAALHVAPEVLAALPRQDAAQIATPRPAPTENPAGKWRTETDSSAFDDSPTVTLLLDAESPVQGAFETSRPTLIIRCQERQLEVYIYTGLQADVEYGLPDQATIRLRYDREAALTVVADESTDGRALFLAQPRATIDALLSHRQLVFGFTPFSASPVETTFDVRGLGNAIQPVFDACG